MRIAVYAICKNESQFVDRWMDSMSEADQVEQILREEMQQAADLQVPLEIDLHRGNNWYEAK